MKNLKWESYKPEAVNKAARARVKELTRQAAPETHVEPCAFLGAKAALIACLGMVALALVITLIVWWML